MGICYIYLSKFEQALLKQRKGISQGCDEKLEIRVFYISFYVCVNVRIWQVWVDTGVSV